MRLLGKVALVTGGGRGIGRAIALALAGEGAQVAVLDLLPDTAAAVCREVEELGVKGLALGADLTRRAEVARAVEDALAHFGPLDIVVNNAGWDRMELFLDSEEETWDRIIAVNFTSVLYVCKAALPPMIARGAGRIVNIGSDAGRVGSTGEAVYSGAKAAVIAFSKALAREVARFGITVNVVCPGLTETPLLQSMRAASARNEKVIDAVARAIPLGRTARPGDIAGAVVYLASPGAEYVTGQTLSVSGGLTMA